MATLRLFFPETLCELVEEYCIAPVYQRKGKSDDEIQYCWRYGIQLDKCMQLEPLSFVQIQHNGHHFSKNRYTSDLEFIYELQPLHYQALKDESRFYGLKEHSRPPTLLRDADMSIFGIYAVTFWLLADNSIITYRSNKYRIEYAATDLRYLIRVKD
jgi:hypothetical protein